MRRSILALVCPLLLAGCQAPPPSAPSAAAPSPTPPAGCTSAAAISDLRQLLAALEAGDGEKAVAFFPEPGTAFVIQPELEVTELQQRATNPVEIRSMSQNLSGMGLELVDPGSPTVGQTSFTSPTSTVTLWTVTTVPRWRAVRARRPDVWGGKVTLNCESGKFLRVAL